MRITPSLLFNYLQCPHKPWRDIYGPIPEKGTDDNPFLQMLWDRGVFHEKEIIENFAEEIEDISQGTIQERLIRTKVALIAKKKYIYQGVIEHGELFGIPDLLELQDDDQYFPIDIKSGSGLEGEDDNAGTEGKQKKHYAVQLCVYSDILIRLGFSRERKGFIIGGDKTKVEYDLDASIGVKSPQSFWSFYEEIKKTVLELIQDNTRNSPAMSSVCKMCAWHDSCKKYCVANDDMTQLFYVGRKVRDILNDELDVATVTGLVNLDLPVILERKKNEKQFLKGVGEKTLTTAVRRAKIFKDKALPVLYEKLYLPEVKFEIHFDIEDDPLQEGFTYLHGLYIRTPEGEEFKSFVAKEFSAEAERTAWKGFWDYIQTLPENDFAIYYYSQHEKTMYKKLQQKYPEVISVENLEAFFNNPNVIDLYHIVSKYTDWPLGSYSIKALAKYLGFKWEDADGNGATSIQWYNEYLTSGDESILQKILTYNKNDCQATMVLRNKLTELNLRFGCPLLVSLTFSS
ncbi:TM0106 family RecB-like putative nuclease [Aurantibacillus circumpalustris]|uniref:TM0106 family RecB-like putative nuclease n=1 Tax=Aurantibacillus circumpalustris TaxID=3036359 RepID=UPI00295B5EDC|nr:TM0106 family RecB-like putative nuclease [Aurantibacillus circumpalustris]